MVQLRIPRRKRAKLRRPPTPISPWSSPSPQSSRNHVPHEPLPRRLPPRKRPQQRQHARLALRVRLDPGLGVCLKQREAQIAPRPALPGVEQQARAPGEDVDLRGGVALLGVAGGDDAELLVGFVELALCDPATGVSGARRREAGWKEDFSCWRAMVFSSLDMLWEGGGWRRRRV